MEKGAESLETIWRGRQSLGTILAMDAGFQCASCGEWIQTTVDHSQGKSQTYVEDCQICCKPNVLHIEYDPSVEEFVITAEPE